MAWLVIDPAIRIAQLVDRDQASFGKGGLCVVRQGDGEQPTAKPRQRHAELLIRAGDPAFDRALAKGGPAKRLQQSVVIRPLVRSISTDARV